MQLLRDRQVRCRDRRLAPGSAIAPEMRYHIMRSAGLCCGVVISRSCRQPSGGDRAKRGSRARPPRSGCWRWPRLVENREAWPKPVAVRSNWLPIRPRAIACSANCSRQPANLRQPAEARAICGGSRMKIARREGSISPERPLLENDLAAAERNLREAIARHPNSQELHKALGDVLAKRGRFEEAIEACDRALGLEPALRSRAPDRRAGQKMHRSRPAQADAHARLCAREARWTMRAAVSPFRDWQDSR